MAGPTVGPDGNIYVVFDFGGLGAVALSPAGQLLWSNPGNPTFIEYGQLGAEIVFDSESLFVAFDEYGAAPTSMLYRLMLDGTQDWAVPSRPPTTSSCSARPSRRSARTGPCTSPA